MIVVIDGNDGTGKTTLAAMLREKGFDVRDRGVPTRMTDDPGVRAESEEIYLILDAPVDVLRARLQQAGKCLEERYHTVEDLTYYRARFLEVAEKLPRCEIIDARKSPDDVALQALEAVDRLKRD